MSSLSFRSFHGVQMTIFQFCNILRYSIGFLLRGWSKKRIQMSILVTMWKSQSTFGASISVDVWRLTNSFGSCNHSKNVFLVMKSSINKWRNTLLSEVEKKRFNFSKEYIEFSKPIVPSMHPKKTLMHLSLSLPPSYVSYSGLFFTVLP